MSDSMSPSQNQNPNHKDSEAVARAWLATIPEEVKTLTMAEFESWVHSNNASYPTKSDQCLHHSSTKSLLRTLCQLSDIYCGRKKDTNPGDNPARFQRTDQWIPVYAWLELLDKDEVVKSKDISDWLTENPTVREQLCSRHSRYHLMHYIKKCHLKILKRREKKKGLDQASKATPLKVQKTVVTKPPTALPWNSPSNLPKDNDAYLAKRNEALRKLRF
ncbi:hypothetical protein CK203_004072 [Vitis vinifera]|uniref:Uncharacterized protein n=1 Tax=Vitis vinifera TaxID=29760 RepID=A0A438K9B7_VITVI|nr:hypothetical protein CK203_004072 [Vitis vinifera]